MEHLLQGRSALDAAASACLSVRACFQSRLGGVVMTRYAAEVCLADEKHGNAMSPACTGR